MTLSVRIPATGRLLPFPAAVAAGLRRPIGRSGALLLLAGLPCLAAAWAILAPMRVFANVMACDLMFNLAGAWHGDRPHVDFHDPLGSLNFFLTALGFALAGLGPRAFLVGTVVVALGLFALAFHAALRRLPLVPAALFVAVACLLALMPANIGDRPDQFTLAMSYNRYGWAAYSVLGLVLFVPPRRDALGGEALEIAGCAVLLFALFFLKITYFAAGLGTLVVATVLQPHVRRNALRWGLVAAALAVWAVLPVNWPYLADIAGAARAGAIRTSLLLHVGNLAAAGGEYAPYIGLVLIGAGLWATGRAPLRLPLSLAFVLATSIGLLTQNSQSSGMPAWPAPNSDTNPRVRIRR